MKIRIAAQEIKAAVESAASLAPGNRLKPILETILLTVVPGGLEIAATNLTSAAWFKVDGGADHEPGPICLPAENFLRIVKQAGKAPLTLSWDGKASRAKVHFGSTKVNLPVENHGDFPDVHRFLDDTDFVSLPVNTLIAGLDRTNFAVAGDFKMRTMAGVCFDVSPGSLRLSATDGIRMCSVDHPIENESYSARTVVRPVDTKWLLRIAGGSGSRVDLQITDRFIRFRGPCGEMVHSTIAGSFPKYDIATQLAHEKKVGIKVSDLRSLLTMATLLKSKGLEWKFRFLKDTGNLVIEATSGLDGEVQADLQVNWTHDDFAIGLDPTKILDALKQVEEESIDLLLGTARQPAVIRENGNGLTYHYALSARV